MVNATEKSRRGRNRNVPMEKYMRIKEERGKEAALEELERDRQYGILARSTYFRIKKRIIEDEVDFNKLFVEFLRFLASTNREKISREELALKLDVDVKVIDEFKKWMEKTGHSKIAMYVIRGKQVNKSRTKVRQRSVRR